MSTATLALAIWTLATAIGTVAAILAIIALRRNWDAVHAARGRPYARILADIVRSNLYQQIGRSLMEVACWAAVILTLYGSDAIKQQVIIWLLVFYRLMHAINSIMEYASNHKRYREHP